MIPAHIRTTIRKFVGGMRAAAPSLGNGTVSAGRTIAAGGIGSRLADASDLMNPAFGASFLARFDDPGASVVPRKRWELCWLAQSYEELYGGGTIPSLLGLGVGQEPLIYHFAHCAEKVVATDLYDEQGVWAESRLTTEKVLSANPFPYPRERVTVRNMDMRSIDYPSESFDVVWSCSSVEHVSTLSEFIRIFREIHRVLKPGGHALITTEYSLDEPYFLPGVLSLWEDCALFADSLQGLSLAGPASLHYNEAFPGNSATRRTNVHRAALLNDLEGGPTGVCLHAGYTRLIPVAFVLRKTGGQFDWPEHLNAPAWYRTLSSGVDALKQKDGASRAVRSFREALAAAESPGSRLHCYRHLIEACVHATDVPTLHATLAECAAALPDLPDDDDALDLIAYVAAGQGQLPFARRCWERALTSPSALPGSRLRIRTNQLAAELQANGNTREACHLSALADAAWCEAYDFEGPHAPSLRLLEQELSELRTRYALTSPISSRIPSAPAASEQVTARRPCFDLTATPARPIVYTGDHLAVTRTIYGHKFYVDTRSQVGACYLLDGYWEEWVARRLTDYVKPGMHVLDLGANMGFFTLLLCDLVGPDGRVTAFEPWPNYHDILRRNVLINGYSDRCKMVRSAVHEKTGTRELVFYGSFGTGAIKGAEAFFDCFEHASPPTTIEVPTVSIDDYLAADPQPVDFIKMDVDGSEPAVFRGMQKFLEGTRPLTIFCEFCPAIIRAVDVDPHAFLDELRAARFEISLIAPDGIQAVSTPEDLTTKDWVELLLVRA